MAQIYTPNQTNPQSSFFSNLLKRFRSPVAGVSGLPKQPVSPAGFQVAGQTGLALRAPSAPINPMATPEVEGSTVAAQISNLPQEEFLRRLGRQPARPPVPEVKDMGTLAPSAPVAGSLPPVSPPAPVSAPPRPEAPSFEPTHQPTPFTPTPAQQAAVASAEKAYLDAQKISPEELSTQEDIDKLVARAANVESSKRFGLLQEEGRPIAMPLITGQQAMIEKQAGAQIQALAAQAEPLERKLARMQAARTAGVEASKFAIERADKAVEAARTEAKETESARRFGIEQAGTAQTRALAEKQFEENKRQFGLDYAIKQREVAAKELEARTKAAEGGGAQGITAESGAALQLVSEILPRVDEISGLIRLGRFTGTADKLTQLVSNLSVNARKLIKGQGAVSDYEARVLAASTNALGEGYFSGKISNDFIEQELKKIRGVINANAGLPVMVKVTDPNTGQAKVGALDRNNIFDAASQGFIVEYQ